MSPKKIYIAITELILKNEPFVLAIVTRAQGSTPQKSGSLAVFTKEGLLTGTIGGGIIEKLVTEKAIEAIEKKKSGYFKFELNDDIEAKDSVICGGKMTILLDANPQEHASIFSSIKEAYSDKVPGVLVTIAKPDNSSNYIVERFWATSDTITSLAKKLPAAIEEEVELMLERERPGDFKELSLPTSENESSYILLETIKPLPELIIAGAGHIGKALSHIAKLIDFEVTVWDDRTEYANTSNLPDADHILSGDFNNSLGKLKASEDTFIVIVTRGHKQDSDVLKHFIRTHAAYIGMIGSKKKVAQIRELFLKNDWASVSEWEKIHAPIGLNIQSKTVNEIALSIAAELIQERYYLYHSNG